MYVCTPASVWYSFFAFLGLLEALKNPDAERGEFESQRAVRLNPFWCLSFLQSQFPVFLSNFC